MFHLGAVGRDGTKVIHTSLLPSDCCARYEVYSFLCLFVVFLLFTGVRKRFRKNWRAAGDRAVAGTTVPGSCRGDSSGKDFPHSRKVRIAKLPQGIYMCFYRKHEDFMMVLIYKIA